MMDEKKILDQYIAESEKHKLLSAVEEVGLAGIMSKFETGDKRKCARDILINSNLRLVVKIAHYYKNKTDISIMDLIGAGNIGLITAIDRFDPVKYNGRLSTYAYVWIKQSILRYVYNHYNAIHVPSNVALSVTRKNKIENSGINIDESELLKELKINEGNLRRVEQAEYEMISFDAPVKGATTNFIKDNGNEVFYKDMIPDYREGSLDKIEKKDTLRFIKEAMSFLSDFDRDILEKRFLADNENCYHEIAKDYNCTGESIRQSINKALIKLRSILKHKYSVINSVI